MKATTIVRVTNLTLYATAPDGSMWQAMAFKRVCPVCKTALAEGSSAIFCSEAHAKVAKRQEATAVK